MWAARAGRRYVPRTTGRGEAGGAEESATARKYFWSSDHQAGPKLCEATVRQISYPEATPGKERSG